MLEQRPHRKTTILGKYRDFVVNMPKLTRNDDSSLSESQGFTVHTVKGQEEYSHEYNASLQNVFLIKEPNSYEEAIAHEGWKNAMQEELDALESNGTWEVTSLP